MLKDRWSGRMNNTKKITWTRFKGERMFGLNLSEFSFSSTFPPALNQSQSHSLSQIFKKTQISVPNTTRCIQGPTDWLHGLLEAVGFYEWRFDFYCMFRGLNLKYLVCLYLCVACSSSCCYFVLSPTYQPRNYKWHEYVCYSENKEWVWNTVNSQIKPELQGRLKGHCQKVRNGVCIHLVLWISSNCSQVLL